MNKMAQQNKFSSLYFSLPLKVRQVLFCLLVLVLIVIILVLIYECINYKSLNNPSDEPQLHFYKNASIEGIYYGQDTQNPLSEPFPVKITKNENDSNNYQLSAENLVIDFRLDEEKGTLFSPSMGLGTIIFNNSSSEIIITFKRWKFKRQNLASN